MTGDILKGSFSTYLLENVHRTTLRFQPDPELGRRFEEEEKSRLAAIREGMSADQLKECVEKTNSSNCCKRLQTRPKPLQPCPS